MNSKALVLVIISGLSVLALSSCQQGDASYDQAPSATDNSTNRGQGDLIDEKNIVGIASKSPDHTTLVAAVVAADLVGVLSNTGPLTVFAPTNAAFDKLPAGTLDDLLKPENKARLAEIITSHAGAGKYRINYLKDGMMLAQATGHKVAVEVKEDGTYVNGSKILATIDASNGIIHVVDDVFLLEK